jgi:hypothetical protein
VVARGDVHDYTQGSRRIRVLVVSSTIDLSRIRFADPAAFGRRHGRVSPTLMARVDSGLRRLLALG